MIKILFPLLLAIFLAIFSILFTVYEEDISYHVFNSYDTEIPSYILMGVYIIVISAVVIFSMGEVYKFIKNNRKRKKLLSTGVDAKAKVLSLDEASDGTVTTINDQPLVTIELEILDRGDAPYKVKIETIISRLEIPKLQPGSIVNVKIDPNNRNKVIIV